MDQESIIEIDLNMHERYVNIYRGQLGNMEVRELIEYKNYEIESMIPLNVNIANDEEIEEIVPGLNITVKENIPKKHLTQTNKKGE